MRFIAIDPSSTELGWAIFGDDKAVVWGIISTAAVPYEKRFTHIIGELTAVYERFGFSEIACERAVRFEGRSIPALEVAVTSIRKWAQRHILARNGKMDISFYSPSEWKVSAAGDGRADKEAVARVICLEYPQLPDDVPSHVTDAIGIGQHHYAMRRLEELAEEA